MANSPTDFLLKLPCKLLFWEIAAQKWTGRKKGWIFLIPYDNNEKTQIVFKPRGEEATTMWYCADVAELQDGLRCKIHEALAVGRHIDDPRAIVFGKAASRSYMSQHRQPIKTAWVARFEEFWEANAFYFMLNRLREHNGRFSAFDDEIQDAAINAILANGEEEYETEDGNHASDEEDSDGNEVIEVIEIISSEEEWDDEEKDNLVDFDVETALRLQRMMTHPEGPSMYDDYDDDEEEEVAESQNLFH
jgi:hypothetical protein